MAELKRLPLRAETYPAQIGNVNLKRISWGPKRRTRNVLPPYTYMATPPCTYPFCCLRHQPTRTCPAEPKERCCVFGEQLLKEQTSEQACPGHEQCGKPEKDLKNAMVFNLARKVENSLWFSLCVVQWLRAPDHERNQKARKAMNTNAMTMKTL